MELKMTASSRTLRLAAIALAPLVWVSAARSEETLKLAPGFAHSVIVNGATAGKFTLIIGNPKIADVTFGPKNTFWFIGLTEGVTNILVLDNETGNEMYNARIEVGGLDRVHVHNKSLLTSYTTYKCAPGCEFVNETTAEEPAPLPRGHSQSASTFQSNSTVTAPTPTIPVAPP
jgi:Pilus formation protein N terminal region